MLLPGGQGDQTVQGLQDRIGGDPSGEVEASTGASVRIHRYLPYAQRQQTTDKAEIWTAFIEPPDGRVPDCLKTFAEDLGQRVDPGDRGLFLRRGGALRPRTDGGHRDHRLAGV